MRRRYIVVCLPTMNDDELPTVWLRDNEDMAVLDAKHESTNPEYVGACVYEFEDEYGAVPRPARLIWDSWAQDGPPEYR